MREPDEPWEAFERRADRFWIAFGIMAPGKDVAPGMCERPQHFTEEEWRARKLELYRRMAAVEGEQPTAQELHRRGQLLHAVAAWLPEIARRLNDADPDATPDELADEAARELVSEARSLFGQAWDGVDPYDRVP